jgi:hypothetical protein
LFERSREDVGKDSREVALYDAGDGAGLEVVLVVDRLLDGVPIFAI